MRHAAALCALCIACATAEEPLSPDTGIEVHVLKGPLQPVAQEGEPDTAPVVGALVSIAPAAGGRVRQGTTDTAGVVRVLVPAGTHRVSVEVCPGTMSLPKLVETVIVSAGTFAATTLVCDTGIR
jgi:hypothetical protein